jgi:hypothetical protein
VVAFAYTSTCLKGHRFSPGNAFVADGNPAYPKKNVNVNVNIYVYVILTGEIGDGWALNGKNQH